MTSNDGRPLLSQCKMVGSTTGTGEQTHIWNDNWIPRDYKLRPICAKTDSPPVYVNELIDASTRQWNMAMLNEHFLDMDKEIILTIPLSTRIKVDF